MTIFNKKHLIVSSFLIVIQLISNAQETKNLIKLDSKTQKIAYLPYTKEGDIIPDFSFCGYKGGGVKITTPNVVKKLSPLEGDNTRHIQAALDSIGKLTPDQNGLRGALLLAAGKYNIAGTLKMNYSGVTLMGEESEAQKTILVATTPKQYTLIKIGESESPSIEKKTKRQVVADYVPSGTKELLLDDSSCFKVGDAITVERPSTAEWIAAIGMDNLEDLWRPIKELSSKDFGEYKKAGRLNADQTNYNSTVQWEPGSKNLKFERKIMAIDGNKIILDIPLTNALQKKYGGALVYKYTFKNRLSEIGIANISAISFFDDTVIKTDSKVGKYYADENHGWTCIDFVNAENCWADNVQVTHFSFAFNCGKYSRFITIQNSSVLDPISQIYGGRRYAFLISGQQCLVYKCYSRNFRHDFVMGAVVAGPNAFVDNKAELCHAASEPHQRWATGTLFENCSVSGPEAYFSLSNRGVFGSGHGWAGAQMVLWNCKSPLAVVMKPPTAENFAFGTQPLTDEWSSPSLIQYRIDKLNKIADKNFQYNGKPAVGDGYIFGNGDHVLPKSLYFQQLKDRLMTTN